MNGNKIWFEIKSFENENVWSIAAAATPYYIRILHIWPKMTSELMDSKNPCALWLCVFHEKKKQQHRALTMFQSKSTHIFKL